MEGYPKVDITLSGGGFLNYEIPPPIRMTIGIL
jgi:hypothetical protein